MKKLVSFVAILLCTASVFAKQISIQVVQHDEGMQEVSEQSFIIEDNLLNGFFDDGYIVTNSQAQVSASENEDETFLKKGLGEAFDGYSDYFIQVKLFYIREGTKDVNRAKLDKAELVVTSVQTGQSIKNSSYQNKANGKQTDLDDISFCLLSEIKKAIKA